MRRLPLYLISAMLLIAIVIEWVFYDTLLWASKLPLLTAVFAALFISSFRNK